MRLGTIVMGAADVGRAVQFWSEALGYRPVSFDDADDGFTILVPPSGEGTRVALHRSSVDVQLPPRLHIDLVVDDHDDQVREIGRLVGLGATRAEWDYPDDPDFVVLLDTEGNPFCIVDAGHA